MTFKTDEDGTCIECGIIVYLSEAGHYHTNGFVVKETSDGQE